MSVKTPAPPPLSGEVDKLLRRLRMPSVRAAAPEVLATAKSQRWDPAEVLRVLLAEEAAGRDRATIHELVKSGRVDVRRQGDGALLVGGVNDPDAPQGLRAARGQDL